MDESIEDMAGDEKRKPGRSSLTKSEIQDRDERLVADRVRKRSWQWIATKYELSTRQCQERFEIWRGKNKHAFESVNAIDIVHEMLDTYVGIQEEAAEMADEAEADNTKLGAINAQMSAMRQAAELMQATGILPKNLGTLRMEVDARVLSQKLVRVLNQHDAPAEMKRAILEEIGGESAGELPVAGLPDASD